MPLAHCLGYTKGSIQAQGTSILFVTRLVVKVRSCQHFAQPPSSRTTLGRLSAIAYSIYLQLPSILETVRPIANKFYSLNCWYYSVVCKRSWE